MKSASISPIRFEKEEIKSNRARDLLTGRLVSTFARDSPQTTASPRRHRTPRPSRAAAAAAPPRSVPLPRSRHKAGGKDTSVLGKVEEYFTQQQFRSQCLKHKYELGAFLARGAYGDIYLTREIGHPSYNLVLKQQLIQQKAASEVGENKSTQELRPVGSEWDTQKELSIHRFLIKYTKQHKGGLKLVPDLKASWTCHIGTSPAPKTPNLRYQISVLERYHGSLFTFLTHFRVVSSTIRRKWTWLNPFHREAQEAEFLVLTYDEMRLLVNLVQTMTAAQVVHGDLHLGNILCNWNTKSITEMVATDFGLAFRFKDAAEVQAHFADRAARLQTAWNHYASCELQEETTGKWIHMAHLLNLLQLEGSLNWSPNNVRTKQYILLLPDAEHNTIRDATYEHLFAAFQNPSPMVHRDLFFGAACKATFEARYRAIAFTLVNRSLVQVTHAATAGMAEISMNMTHWNVGTNKAVIAPMQVQFSI